MKMNINNLYVQVITASTKQICFLAGATLQLFLLGHKRQDIEITKLNT